MIQPLRLSILFTSDEHGFLHGADAVRRVAAEARRENPDGTLLVSSGDVFKGAPESDLLQGEPALEVLAATGYDAVAVGNHDFDNGHAYARRWIASAPYPVLTSNVGEQDGTLLKGARAHAIFEKNGVKVGLIGATTPETPALGYPSWTEGLTFGDPVESVRRAAQELREQGADVVGVLSHLGTPGDRDLAARVEGLDFILGGHTHEFLETPEVGPSGTLICQPGCYRDGVGRLDFEVDPKTHRILGHQHRLIRVDPADGQADGEVARIAERALKTLQEAQGAVLGRTEVPLGDQNALEPVLGAAMCREARTSVALFNRKLMRTGLDSSEISAGQMRKIIPFDNFVWKVRLTRADLVDALNRSLWLDDGRSLVPHGLSVKTTPDGSQVENVYFADGSPLPDTLDVATTDFLAQGAVGYFPLGSKVSEHAHVREVLTRGLSEDL